MRNAPGREGAVAAWPTGHALARTTPSVGVPQQGRSRKPPSLPAYARAVAVVLFSLAVGTALDCALGPCRGKRTGETSLFAALRHNLEEGDILLADRYYGSYWEMALARQRGADAVVRLHQRRKADFRLGRRLGREDHVVAWAKPRRPPWMDEATYAALPATLQVREARVRVAQPGFRTRVLVVATTLLDAGSYPRQDVGLLYRVRWYAEIIHPDYRPSDKLGWSRGPPCRTTIEMSGLDAIEMSSLRRARGTYVYRVQRRRPDTHESTGT